MRTLWSVFKIFLVVHLFAAAAFLFWLRYSERLDKQRLRGMYEMFRMSIPEEKAGIELAKAEEAMKQQRAYELARLESMEKGPKSVQSRLTADRQTQQVAAAKLDRFRADVATLMVQIEEGKRIVKEKEGEVEALKKELQAQMQTQDEQQRDRDFQMTVKMYEQLKPKQAKEMFQELVASGESDQVVEFLAAMNIRKAGAILKQFKDPDEIVQATALLQMLRSRGVDPLDGQDISQRGM